MSNTRDPFERRDLRIEWRVTVGEKEITSTDRRKRLISLTHTDQRGFESDSLDLDFDDSDGALALPVKGVEITLAFGWENEGLVSKGKFIVAEISHRGSPDVLSVRATSADLAAGLSTQRERSWDKTTLGNIVRTIASEHDLQSLIHDSLADQVIGHEDQTNESNANFLTRLAKRYDAYATVKNKSLIVSPAGTGITANGTSIPPLYITRQSGDQHSFLTADRDTYAGVRAQYNDVDSAIKGEVIWGDDEDAVERKNGQSGSAFERTADNIKTLRHVYANKANAQRAARAEWRRLQRGAASFNYTPAIGIPEACPDTPAILSGWKDGIDGSQWIVTKVNNTISADGGYVQGLEFEVMATELAEG